MDVTVLNIQPEMVERHARPKAAPPCIRFGVWERLAYAWRICKGLVGGLEGYNPIEFSWAYSKIWDLGLCIAAGIEHKQFLVICFFVYILAPHDLSCSFIVNSMLILPRYVIGQCGVCWLSHGSVDVEN